MGDLLPSDDEVDRALEAEEALSREAALSSAASFRPCTWTTCASRAQDDSDEELLLSAARTLEARAANAGAPGVDAADERGGFVVAGRPPGEPGGFFADGDGPDTGGAISEQGGFVSVGDGVKAVAEPGGFVSAGGGAVGEPGGFVSAGGGAVGEPGGFVSAGGGAASEEGGFVAAGCGSAAASKQGGFTAAAGSTTSQGPEDDSRGAKRRRGAAEPSAADATPRTPAEALVQRMEALCLSTGAGAELRGPPCPAGAASGRVVVRGVEVLFPFAEPLPPQRMLMDRALEALQTGKHALLESPTGTGKTAALLCAALAWQRQRKTQQGSAPQLIFASRTHSQLRQALAELRRLPYRPITAVLGSRESGLCVLPAVAETAFTGGQRAVRQACRQARRDGSCGYYRGLQAPGTAEAAVSRLRGQVWDIEEAANFGERLGACPYYTAHALARYAELVFCPYSYVLDPSVRRAAGSSMLDLQGRVVVLDEAHNVEGNCREVGSTMVTVDNLRAVQAALKRAIEGIGEADPGAPLHPLQSAPAARGSKKGAAPELGGFMTTPAKCEDPARTRPDAESRWPKLSQHLARTARPLSVLIGRLCSFITEAHEGKTFAPHLAPSRRPSVLLRDLALHNEPLLAAAPCGSTRGEVLLRDLAAGGPALELAATLLARLAAAVATPELYVVKLDVTEPRALHLWLMGAEGALAPLARSLHSLLLMSGTLAPLAATLGELGPSFCERALPPLSAGHVVGQSALKVFSVASLGAVKIECNFRAWKRVPFLLAVGTSVLSLVRSVPGGALVFFPSYDLLERCVEAWQGVSGRKKARGAVQRITEIDASAVWEQLVATKGTLVVEPAPAAHEAAGPEAARAHEAARKKYEDAVRRDGRALLLAVYRGRMSEGVSFDDDFARAVVCVGIPFPNLTEERISQKRACNDFWVRDGQGSVTGDAWYEAKALHAVAQALGRCIRHPRDYGALLLLDSRWAELGKSDGLPRWLHPFLMHCETVDDAVAKLRDHFTAVAAARARAEPEVQPQSVVAFNRSAPAKLELPIQATAGAFRRRLGAGASHCIELE